MLPPVRLLFASTLAIQVLLPPLTYLQPTGKVETVQVKQPGASAAVVEFQVIEVQPHFPS